MKDLFYGLMTIILVIGVIIFGADQYAKYESKQMVMTEFGDDGSMDIDYEYDKIGPLMYKCTGHYDGFIFDREYTAVAGFDLEELVEIIME